MFTAFANCLKIPDLRDRIFFTLALVFVARVGAHIPLPGIDSAPLQNFFADQTAAGAGALMGLYNMFTGGALLKGAVCALGIMPYISASIIFQLMNAVRRPADVDARPRCDRPQAGRRSAARTGLGGPGAAAALLVRLHGAVRAGQDAVRW
jgi:preprotein translocase subunit SecY